MLWMLMLFRVKKAQIVQKTAVKCLILPYFTRLAYKIFQFLPFFDNFEFLVKCGGQYGSHLGACE